MEARVKATGAIVNVTYVHYITNDGIVRKKIYKDQFGNEYFDSELDFSQEREYIPDYWTRLEHQYAGMAMQGILSNPNIAYKDISNEILCNHWANNAIAIAHALVEKMKEKEDK